MQRGTRRSMRRRGVGDAADGRRGDDAPIALSLDESLRVDAQGGRGVDVHGHGLAAVGVDSEHDVLGSEAVYRIAARRLRSPACVSEPSTASKPAHRREQDSEEKSACAHVCEPASE